MGIVQRQGIKGTIVSYIGAILGAITILFVYPYCMNTEEIGLFRLILDSAIFFLNLRNARSTLPSVTNTDLPCSFNLYLLVL